MIVDDKQPVGGSLLTIRKCAISEIEDSPNINEILAEYALECATDGAGVSSPQWDIYRAIEASGALQSFGAFVDGLMVGFITVAVMRRPHYEQPIASYESYFVLSRFRKTGAGMALLRTAKEYAKDSGAPGLFVNAAVGSDLDGVLSGIGARHTHNVRFIPLKTQSVANNRPQFQAMPEPIRDQVGKFCDAIESVGVNSMHTDHVLHAGTYARTMKLEAGHVLVGTVVQVDTVVIFHGKAKVFVGDGWVLLDGYHVIPAAAMRQQVFESITDCYITAIFATDATTVEEAEAQATSTPDALLSRAEESRNSIFILGEKPCLTQP